jgi:hypothetical protein
MDNYDVLMMSEKELRFYIEKTTNDMSQLAYWATLETTDHGKKLVEEFEKRLASVRALYFSIHPSDGNFVAKMSRLQGVEEELQTEINRIKNAGQEKKRLDKIIALCLSELQRRTGSPRKMGRDQSKNRE